MLTSTNSNTSRGRGAPAISATHRSHKGCCLGVHCRLVVKGWLAALLPTLEAHPRTGLVGPMLADRQGKASGSPGIIFEDASTALYLEGAALHHSLNHKRRADYVPGACMVVPKFLFDKIGGFDSQVGRQPASSDKRWTKVPCKAAHA